MELEEAQRLIAEAVREMRRAAPEEGTRGSRVLTLVNAVLDTALAEEATDIHLEPMDGRLRIRLRVDGLLQERPIQFPTELASAFVLMESCGSIPSCFLQRLRLSLLHG